MKFRVLFFFLFHTYAIWAQRNVEGVVSGQIAGIKFFQSANQMSLPLMKLQQREVLELHFDDLDGYAKNYFYTYELCNADWTPVQLSAFDYISGFTQGRITQFRPSSVAFQKYVHYQIRLPESSCMPTRSGNYILKVFLNGDTNQLVFTKRMLIAEDKATIAAQVLQPYQSQVFLTHQRVQFSVNAGRMQLVNPQQQIKVVVVQNNMWDRAVRNIQPVFIRGNVLEYNGEQDVVFPGGKEYRWADLRSFRFVSDRMESANLNARPVEVVMRPDQSRSNLRYIFFRDLNGWYELGSTDMITHWWQGDFARVKFQYQPPNSKPFEKEDLHMVGELTGFQISDSSKMKFNEQTGAYEKELYLKQGYYTYQYMTKEPNAPPKSANIQKTEGNFWETENEYLILVYYRALTGRHDELVAIQSIRSGPAPR